MSKKSLIPFFVLIVLILIVYVTNLHQVLSLNHIREYQHKLLEFVNAHPFLSPLIFILFYTISVCLVIPDSTILSLAAGLVFPLPLAILYIIFAETVGGVAFFAIMQNVFKGVRTDRPFFKKMRKKFHQHEVSYLLFLRFSHVLPFWLTNVCAAYFNISYKTFIWTCLIGSIPLTVILADAGHSLSVLFEKNQFLYINDIFTPSIKFAFLALGLLALAPIVYQHFRQRKK